jgi:hypothetical protein
MTSIPSRAHPPKVASNVLRSWAVSWNIQARSDLAGTATASVDPVDLKEALTSTLHQMQD